MYVCMYVCMYVSVCVSVCICVCARRYSYSLPQVSGSLSLIL